MGRPFLATTSLRPALPLFLPQFPKFKTGGLAQMAPEAFFEVHRGSAGSSGLGSSDTRRVPDCSVFQKDLHAHTLLSLGVLFTVEIPLKSTGL